MDWTIANQKMLQQIFLENRHKQRLAKNRIEKLRAREKSKKETKKENNNIIDDCENFGGI